LRARCVLGGGDRRRCVMHVGLPWPVALTWPAAGAAATCGLCRGSARRADQRELCCDTVLVWYVPARPVTVNLELHARESMKTFKEEGRPCIGRYNSCPTMGASQRSSHESHRIFLATNLGRPFFFTETYKTDTATVRNPSRRPSLPNPASLILPQSRRSPPPPIPSWLTRRLPIFRMNSSRRHRRDEGQAAAHAPSHLAGMKGRPPLMPPAISPLAVPTRRAVAGRSVVRGRQMQSSP
jgi:hypothetical protein